MKPRLFLFCVAGALLCACSSNPEPAQQRQHLRVKRMEHLSAHASRRAMQIQKATQECRRIHVRCGEEIWKLSPDAMVEMKDILSRVQPITQWGGLCATPGVTIRITFLDSQGCEFKSLTNWEIIDADNPSAPYHSTLTLPSEDYRRFQEILQQPGR